MANEIPLWSRRMMSAQAQWGTESLLRSTMLTAMRKAQAPAAIIYAFLKTDRLLIEGITSPKVPQSVWDQWNAAIAEYYDLREAGRDPLPLVWRALNLDD
ncbi:MAG TPA: hypothetical protein VH539_10375 [Gemmatimonadaceae bacterium]|jgi:hypothetical protein